MRRPRPDVPPIEAVVATRDVTLAGRTYAKGERVDTSSVSDHKVRQLLNQRILAPAP